VSTKKYARAYQAASEKDKGRILDQVVEVTSWNRDHARQQLKARAVDGPLCRMDDLTRFLV